MHRLGPAVGAVFRSRVDLPGVSLPARSLKSRDPKIMISINISSDSDVPILKDLLLSSFIYYFYVNEPEEIE